MFILFQPGTPAAAKPAKLPYYYHRREKPEKPARGRTPKLLLSSTPKLITTPKPQQPKAKKVRKKRKRVDESDDDSDDDPDFML